ncbi:hypothetical protein EIN_229420 [Entamoeba invadens IP1]|uniref:Rab-GAP TBC domain-containing protein n=1 Tax=Entamoeba invadens IP1 TaxID=370355 RepID=A0A0A1U319_ENTIV|nr:hypothetical protein EIN_229420 [Entamoeba invadens IP1]ELP88419.1 hypothetical protein EIN_229420 [Entamoeba invadens IP1]|eukprot:XP_004255190.1 hypothetical protein EIN_229420 [Entamoeba invadens IP1]
MSDQSTLDSYFSSTQVVCKDVLRQYAQHGITDKLRPVVWKVLSGYLPEDTSLHEAKQKIKKAEYCNLVNFHFHVTKHKYPKAWKNVKDQIGKDIPRMSLKPFKIFKCKQFCQMLERISVVWSFEHADILFFQGLLDWVAVIILPFLFEHVPFEEARDISDIALFTDKWLLQIEADCYFTMSIVLEKYRELLEADFGRIFNAIQVLEKLIEVHHPILHTFLQEYPTAYMIATRSFICPFTRNFYAPYVFYLFDALMTTEMLHTHFYFVAGMFLENEELIIQSEDVIQTIQSLPTHEWGLNKMRIYISNAMMLYFNDTKNFATIFAPMSDPFETPPYLKNNTSQLTLKQLPHLDVITECIFRYALAFLIIRIFISLFTIIAIITATTVKKKLELQKK